MGKVGSQRGKAERQRRDAAANRQAVIDAAARLLPENPTASMQEIADYTGLGRSTVYRHFPNRQALFRAMIRDVVAETIEGVDAVLAQADGVDDALRAIASSMIESALRFQFLYSHRKESKPTLQKLARSDRTPLSQYLAAAQRRGEVRDDQPVSWIVANLIALTIAMVGDVVSGRIERDAAANVLGDTLVAMVVPR